ncbi:MAG TPA: lipid II flippase MurJ, partial [Planctomycetaceae bacterium]|nr:lipid II flippase MurJ [Planctomycetaceae bacterium]
PRTVGALRSIGLLNVCMLGQMGLQLAYQLVLFPALFGASAEMDAFNAVMAVPQVLGTILVGSLQYAFVPVYMHERERGGEPRAHGFSTEVGLALFLVLGATSLVCSLFAAELAAWLWPGFSPETHALSVALLRRLSWLTLLSSATSYLQTVAFCEQRFVAPALGPVIGIAVSIAWTWLRGSVDGIYAAADGILIGSVLTVAWLVPDWLRQFHWPTWDRQGLRELAALLLPLLIGGAYFKLDPLVDRYLASRFSTGDLAHLGYAYRIGSGLLTLTVNGLASVVFPAMARQAAGGRFDELRTEFSHALRFLGFVLIPLLFALGLYHHELVRDVLQRGRFTPEDTLAVGWLTWLYAGLLLGGAIGEIGTKGFFALGDTRTPVVVCCLGFTVGIVLKFALAARWGVDALAWATSAYYLLNAVLTVWLLSLRLRGFAANGLLRSLARSFAAALVSALVVAPLVWSEYRYTALVGMAIAGARYLVLMRWMGDDIAKNLLRRKSAEA